MSLGYLEIFIVVPPDTQFQPNISKGWRAGPGAKCPSWVKRRNTRCEQMFSALPPRPDIAQCGRHVRFVPQAEVNDLFDHLVGTAEQWPRDAASHGRSTSAQSASRA